MIMQHEQTFGSQPGKDDGQADTPSNPIETPEEVPASNDEKIDQDFPGYPHYPAKDDILDPDNNEGRVDVDVENLTRANKVPAENLNQPFEIPSPVETTFPIADDDAADDLGIVSGTEADVTEEDLALLGALDKDMDLDEDETILEKAPWQLDAGGDDLDVPGAELDDENEIIGEEDEENNYYSLGGDNHENLEEDNKNNY